MARKTIVVQPVYEITSDLSGEVLASDAVTNVKFTLKVDETPVQWGQIDLSVEERETLVSILAPYFQAAKEAKNYGEGKVTVAQNGGKTEEVKAMRDWAMATHAAAGNGGYVFDGKTLSAPAERGRLAGEWKAAYAAAHSTTDEGHASEAAIESAIATGEAIKAEGTESATAVTFTPPKGKGK